ncbi:MAG: hypothetical protein AB7V45_17030 [Candidatus Krumholzibacteriia bacterium]
MSRSYRIALVTLCILACLPSGSRAKEVDLNRQEVTVIKKKLVAVEESLSPLPVGYAKSEEDFGLPTSVQTGDKGGFRPVYASASYTFEGGGALTAEKTEKELEAEYKKKIMEAQAKGDYQAIQTLSQEMMQKAMSNQMAAEEAKRDPVRVYVTINGGAYATIDPDAVVFEKPGVIALKTLQNQGQDAQVMIYVDPVKLKETGTLSKIELQDDQDAAGKTTVRHITIELSGPAAVVEAWSKTVDTGKALAQIDR